MEVEGPEESRGSMVTVDATERSCSSAEGGREILSPGNVLDDGATVNWTDHLRLLSSDMRMFRVCIYALVSPLCKFIENGIDMCLEGATSWPASSLGIVCLPYNVILSTSRIF